MVVSPIEVVYVVFDIRSQIDFEPESESIYLRS